MFYNTIASFWRVIFSHQIDYNGFIFFNSFVGEKLKVRAIFEMNTRLFTCMAFTNHL